MFRFFSLYTKFSLLIAQMVELVDTLVSGTSGRKVVGVRVPLWVPSFFFALIFFRIHALMVELVDMLL